MVRLSEQENHAALAAAKARGAQVAGQLSPRSKAIVAEEKAKIVAARSAPETETEAETGEPMRSAGELAQDEALGAPSAGGGA